MARIGDWFAWQTLTGQPVEAGPFKVTPVSRRLTVRWPGGGLLWHYPAALLVEQPSRRKRARPKAKRITIPDPTRTLWLVLIGCTLLALMVAGLASLRRS
jgi:hypothetical protein